jgi:hypothetical protein
MLAPLFHLKLLKPSLQKYSVRLDKVYVTSIFNMFRPSSFVFIVNGRLAKMLALLQSSAAATARDYTTSRTLQVSHDARASNKYFSFGLNLAATKVMMRPKAIRLVSTTTHIREQRQSLLSIVSL